MKKAAWILLCAFLLAFFSACASPTESVGSGSDLSPASDVLTDRSGSTGRTETDPAATTDRNTVGTGKTDGTASVTTDPPVTDTVTERSSDTHTQTHTQTQTQTGTVTTVSEWDGIVRDSVTGRNLRYDDDPAKPCPVLVFDHYENDLYLMDASVTDWTSPSAILWKWTCKKAKGGKFTKYATTCVDHKYRKNASTGAEYIVTGGHAYACLVSYPDGEILWDVGISGANIHSMEYLPDGNVALADSNGWLRVYAVDSAREAEPYYAESLFDGCHGVLWDPQRQTLWAIGTPSLREYRVGGTKAKPTLTLLHEYPLPSRGGHDLAAVYGDTDLLWCTAGSTWIFSKSKGVFFSTFNGSNALHSGVKGIGNSPDSSHLLWVYPNGTHNAYHSDRIWVTQWVLTAPGKVKTVTTERVSPFAFYKLRIFCSDYQ